QDRVPLTFEYGVTRKVTLTLSIPLVLSYVGAAYDINRLDPSPANIAFNPGFNTPAVAANATTVQQQAAAAVQALQAAYPSCFGASPGGACASTIALAQNTTALGAGVLAVFGATGRFAPVAGSPLHTALLARFTALNAQLRTALGVPVGGADPITARPAAAPVRMGLQDFNTLLLTSPYGVNGDTLTVLERSALGDVQLGARWQWLNTVEGAERDTGRANPSGLRLRSVAGIVAHLPTAAKPYLGQLLDVGVDNAATGIELRSTTDIIAGDHFWTSVTGRYTHMLAGTVDRRIPLSAAEALVPAYRRASVTRQVGDWAELEVSPRWMFNDYFAVSGDYQLFLQRATTFRGGPITVTDPFSGSPQVLDPSVLDQPHQLAHRAGFGIAYSTVAAAARGKTRIPLDIRWQRIMTVAGESTPFVMQDRLEVRVITSLFGHK
ncbi:MAG: hypothetical protein HY275_12055, partial [Gemmatimonadetes bacterium]|nr:hypothetical protein [Gemmatimonadota bacterium]